MSFEKLLAERTRRISASVIREILKVACQPDVISLAGGLPAPETFPLHIIEELTRQVNKKYSDHAFQYTRTEGFPPLQQALAGYLKQKQMQVEPDMININCGSQGVLDAIGKILISPGDKIAVEAPTYLGAIQAFNPYLPQYIRMDTDEEGLIPESLEETIKTHQLKFVYLVPTFQNPTGLTLTLPRREKIAKIIQKYNVLLIEDDPYSELRYRGRILPPIKNMAFDHVIYISTFSKIFAPGLRIGYAIAPPDLAKWLILSKQGVDLHTSTFNQALAAEYINNHYLDKQIPHIISIYKPRQEAMLNAMAQFFPDSVHWTRPEGGMFIWATGPGQLDMDLLYQEAIREKVAYVPGRYFYTQKGEGKNTIRLNFTNTDEKTIELAIKKLAKVLKKHL